MKKSGRWERKDVEIIGTLKHFASLLAKSRWGEKKKKRRKERKRKKNAMPRDLTHAMAPAANQRAMISGIGAVQIETGRTAW